MTTLDCRKLHGKALIEEAEPKEIVIDAAPQSLFLGRLASLLEEFALERRVVVTNRCHFHEQSRRSSLAWIAD